ncbi:hypothetical protein Tco_1241195 [Tanacetum coccineum]
MLQICPKLPDQQFKELPFEEESLRFSEILVTEEFVYQVENNNVKRSNEMYYPRFTKDDPMFTTIKLFSRHNDTQLYGAILPDELTNEAIKESESYKEYYAIVSEPNITFTSLLKQENKMR